MKLRLSLLLGATLLVLGIIAAGCDGDGELTLEEYFQRLDELNDDAEERFDAFEEESNSVEDEIEALRDFYNTRGSIFRDFIDAVDDIDPPPEAEEAHKEFVQAGEDFGDVFVRFADVESASELEELNNDPEVIAVSERFEQACFKLREIADTRGIDLAGSGQGEGLSGILAC